MLVRPESPGGVVVTVLVPAYNAARWLLPALKSAASQTLQAIEILVVDDGSKDDTAAMVEALASQDPRVRLIRQPNAGVGAARNTAILAARGKYLAPLDADDVWYPEKLELQVRAMEEGGESRGLVYCWSEKIDSEGRKITDAHPFEIEGSVVDLLILRNFIGNASSPMFRASALAETGLYLTRDEQGGAQGCEDWDLSIRVAERYGVAVVRQTLVGYRQIEDCMSLNVEGMSRSYGLVMDRARCRNPGLPSKVFRWSAGNFHSYLVSKCYLWGNYRGCLRSICRAIVADPRLGMSHKFHMMGLKSLVRLATGSRGRLPQGATVPGGRASGAQAEAPHLIASDGLQNRRWQQLLSEKPGRRAS